MNRLGTAVLAKEMGLDPVEFAQPFPGNQSITINKYPDAKTETQVSPKPLIRKGLSTIAALGLGALSVALPGTGVLIGYLLNKTPAITNTIEKIIEKPGTAITTPGQDYNVEVDMEVIPPPAKQE